jgi:hypothetical protein
MTNGMGVIPSYIDLLVKATAKAGKGKFLRFPLKVKNYENLIGQR